MPKKWFQKYFSCVVPRKKANAAKHKNLSGNCYKIRQRLLLTDHHFLCFPLSGRVHSAMVSKLNPAQRSVTVEWYERGETKGKEVELDMLLGLNPEIYPNRQQSQPLPPPPTTTAPVNLQRVSECFGKQHFHFRMLG